ncbi:MAG: hypothetical protein ABGX05_14525 [Pirellulaceae bacterium]
MSQNQKPITDDQIDAYLDGLLDQSQHAAFQQQLATHPEIAREIQLQQQIDATLQRQFPPASAPEGQLPECLASPSPPPSLLTIESGRRASHRVWRLAAVGVAAAVIWIVAIWQLGPIREESPFFEPLPVATVYRDVLKHGFEPYYECDEEARFAATFSHRLGQPLRLAALPLGSRMLGISYPGGLSRDTTAMLCRVDGQPVMVFVDRLSADQPQAGRNDDPHLRVHRAVKSGLVFYEVTPFDTARLLDYLLPAP